MEVTAETLKAWLSAIEEDRHWLAEQIGVSKRTLDNWFSDGFPLYAQKSIARLKNELEGRVPEIEESAIHLSIQQWKELHRRALDCGFEDEMEFVNVVLREVLAASENLLPFVGRVAEATQT